MKTRNVFGLVAGSIGCLSASTTPTPAMTGGPDPGGTMGEGPTLAQAARIFFNTGANLDTNDSGSYSFRVVGDRGGQEFTFASGTMQANIITAINQFVRGTGVRAQQDALYPELIKLRSVGIGPTEFVAARRTGGSVDGLLLNEHRRRPANQQGDRGE